MYTGKCSRYLSVERWHRPCKYCLNWFSRRPSRKRGKIRTRADKRYIRYGSWGGTGNYGEWVICFNLIDKKETDIKPVSKERKVWKKSIKNLLLFLMVLWYWKFVNRLWAKNEDNLTKQKSLTFFCKK